MMLPAVALLLPALSYAYCTGDHYCRVTVGEGHTCEKQGSGGWDAWYCKYTKGKVVTKHEYTQTPGCVIYQYLGHYYNTDKSACATKCDGNPHCKAFYMYDPTHCQLTKCNKDSGDTCSYDTEGCDDPTLSDLYIKGAPSGRGEMSERLQMPLGVAAGAAVLGVAAAAVLAWRCRKTEAYAEIDPELAA